MDGKICYLNTDLDLISPEDLAELAAVLKSGGVPPLYVTAVENGLCRACFETESQFAEPEPNIAAMVAVIEMLDTAHHSVWRGCTTREFNIGYDCGDEPWAFHQGLSSELLGRIAAIGASLRWTLYPDKEESNDIPDH